MNRKIPNVLSTVRGGLISLCFVHLGAWSQTVMPQAGPNPFPIPQGSSTDTLVVLTAGSAERLSTTSVKDFGNPKYGWVYAFDSADEYLKWTVSVPQASFYQVKANMTADKASQTMQLAVDGGTPSSTVVSQGWSQAQLGTIFLNPGTHTITLRRSNPSGDVGVKSLELLRDADQNGYGERLTAFKADTTAFSKQKYGVMFQYGPWGYPQSGAKKSINQQAKDFDVPAFVAKIKGTGAEYLIWSISWWTYQFDAPISELSTMLGNSDRIASRDLIGEIASALSKEGIDFYLYYHTGQDSHLGYNSTDWWRAQAFPNEFKLTGQGDRSAFFKNWKTIVGAVGSRYGALLKGWFFDDGLVYYPAAFEDLSTVARTGNASRLVSYNSWVGAKFTEFQDVSFGETCKSGDADTGGTGRYLRGGETDLAGHCMYLMESDWGVKKANQSFGSTRYSVNTALQQVQYNAARGVPSSFNLMMYEDGTMSQPSLDVLSGLSGQLKQTGRACSTGCTELNDNAASIAYSSGWRRSSNRGAGDFGDDVSYTTANGGAATVSFTGQRVRLYMPMSSAQGNFEVFVDGVSRGQYSAYLPNGFYTPRVKVFELANLSTGSHQLKVVKHSGNYMQIDKVEVE